MCNMVQKQKTTHLTLPGPLFLRQSFTWLGLHSLPALGVILNIGFDIFILLKPWLFHVGYKPACKLLDFAFRALCGMITCLWEWAPFPSVKERLYTVMSASYSLFWSRKLMWGIFIYQQGRRLRHTALTEWFTVRVSVVFSNVSLFLCL